MCNNLSNVCILKIIMFSLQKVNCEISWSKYWNFHGFYSAANNTYCRILLIVKLKRLNCRGVDRIDVIPGKRVKREIAEPSRCHKTHSFFLIVEPTKVYIANKKYSL